MGKKKAQVVENLKRLHESKWSAEQVDQLIAKVTNSILSRTNPVAIFVFGSAVTGEFDEYSDLDLVAVFKTRVEAKAAQSLLCRPPLLTDRGVDLLCVDQDTFDRKSEIGGVYWIAKREGRLVHKV